VGEIKNREQIEPMDKGQQTINALNRVPRTLAEQYVYQFLAHLLFYHQQNINPFIYKPCGTSG
jgi:hypothetical protein